MSTEPIETATELVLEVFRANGALLAAGDAIAARQDLTSARWQVLGAVALAERALTVPQIARRMGLTRQSVQLSVNRLVDAGLLAAEDNLDHRRSPLFAVTARGAEAYARLTADQRSWIARLTEGLPAADLQTTVATLQALSARMDHDSSGSST